MSTNLTINASEVGAASPFTISKKTLHGGLADGVDVVEINNGKLAFTVIPTRGMSLHRGRLGALQLGWQSPVRGPVHPRFVPLMEPSGLGWLDGFDELLVRCGLESNGAPEFDEQGRLKYPLHGRIGNRPAHHVEVSFDTESGEIRLKGVVDETRFHFTKLRLTTTIVTNLGENSLRIHDEIENLSGSEASMELLYHVNFGLPLLDAGAQLIAPVKTVAPQNAHAAQDIDSWNHYAAEDPTFEEQVYFLELLADANDHTRTLLKNSHGTNGVCLHFHKKQLPCFTLWKNTTSAADGCVTGLEPGVNFPNPRSFEEQQGRVVRLPVGGKHTVDLKLEALENASQVSAAEEAVHEIAAGVAPKLHRTPRPDWSAS